jgi:hypothetical protein
MIYDNGDKALAISRYKRIMNSTEIPLQAVVAAAQNIAPP